MDGLLLKVLGASFSEGEVLQRQSLGNIVHIFSHIRMTLLVERLVLKVCSSCSVSRKNKSFAMGYGHWGNSSCHEGDQELSTCLSHKCHQVTVHQCAVISPLLSTLVTRL